MNIQILKHHPASCLSSSSDLQECKQGRGMKERLKISEKLSLIMETFRSETCLNVCQCLQYFYSSSLTLGFHFFQETLFKFIQVLFPEIYTCFTNIYRVLLCRMCHCFKVMPVTWYLLQGYF